MRHKNKKKKHSVQMARPIPTEERPRFKTEFGYAVYCSEFGIIYFTCSSCPRDAVNRLTEKYSRTWDDFERKGYTVEKIKIERIK